MKRRKRKKSHILEKVVSYVALFFAGEILFGVGGYFCIMTHLPDAVGIPLMTAGFFLIVVFSCTMQEEYDRFISRRYSGRPVYRVGRAGVREKSVKIFVDLDGVLAKWDAKVSVEDTYAPGFFLTREPDVEIKKESGCRACTCRRSLFYLVKPTEGRFHFFTQVCSDNIQRGRAPRGRAEARWLKLR